MNRPIMSLEQSVESYPMDGYVVPPGQLSANDWSAHPIIRGGALFVHLFLLLHLFRVLGVANMSLFCHHLISVSF